MLYQNFSPQTHMIGATTCRLYRKVDDIGLTFVFQTSTTIRTVHVLPLSRTEALSTAHAVVCLLHLSESRQGGSAIVEIDNLFTLQQSGGGQPYTQLGRELVTLCNDNRKKCRCAFNYSHVAPIGIHSNVVTSRIRSASSGDLLGDEPVFLASRSIHPRGASSTLGRKICGVEGP